ncbi:MAG TPA: dihydrofolate reductase family protein [Acidimicrobiales bacterium]|jgi:dihydrofolate reductase|nr:dihydrofolate reductase family protein [Acidimicrobiales bacterium]
MHRTIVIAFTTLDGVVEDPDGTDGTPNGGWLFRYGPEAVAGDQFRLGGLFDTGTLLLGARTWRHFAQLWPTRTDEFAANMNRVPKLVATKSITDLSAWANSSAMTGDLEEAVAQHKTDRDVMIMGSTSLVHTLAAQDLVDEYRIMQFPELAGPGTRLFGAGTVAGRFSLVTSEMAGPNVYMRYVRAA